MSLQTGAPPSQQPSLPRRIASSAVMGLTGLICKAILYGTNRVEVVGLDKFIERLDKRRDPANRERGLITVSNHISVVDDPLMWGIMPLRYCFDPQNLRWGLGAADICYANPFFANFFNVGQTLPTHRKAHSPHGGLFQPTMTQAIRLLSSHPYTTSLPSSSSSSSPPPTSSSPSLPPTYSPDNGLTTWPAPSAYPSNALAWVHIYPEGLVHQQAPSLRGLRYFKWGVARLILESEPAPDLVPIFVDGTDRIMPEHRTFPRFLPRLGQRVRIAVGDAVDLDAAAFGDLRARWRRLVDSEARRRRWETGSPVGGAGTGVGVGELASDELRCGREAESIRVECARRVRDEILKVRRSLGYPDEDPAYGLAETWAKDPHEKRYRSTVDGSMVNQD